MVPTQTSSRPGERGRDGAGGGAGAARLRGAGPTRRGLPLDGWDLAVVDAQGNPVGEGESGELVIGGVGLARYLDPAKDAEK
ncbi:hypothetical protein, partial [Nocardia farcinica]|uniref:hypothetical protein n=1 Tax=Nocardia farcinica TaxID=37329 RepID=UPI00245408A4